MNAMKISIIIPVYNKSKYLRTILQQICGQSFADYECLLIDDGSTDGSGIICDEFAAADDRFNVFHIPNGGVSHARNVGLDAAKGEYITFIDADDGIHKDYLLRLYSNAKDNNVSLVIGNLKKVWCNSESESVIPVPYCGVYSMETLLPDFAKIQKDTGIYGFCVAKLIHHELITDIRFDESVKLAEDLAFYLEVYPRVEKIYFDATPYYYYLQEAENSTSNTASEKIDYLAQLKINLHYRAMLQKRAAYSGENKAIVDRQLADYAYFVLFHTPISFYKERFRKLYTLCKEEKVPLVGESFLRKWLFFCLRTNIGYAAKWTMALYRFARSIRNKLR